MHKGKLYGSPGVERRCSIHPGRIHQSGRIPFQGSFDRHICHRKFAQHHNGHQSPIAEYKLATNSRNSKPCAGNSIAGSKDKPIPGLITKDGMIIKIHAVRFQQFCACKLISGSNMCQNCRQHQSDRSRTGA